MGLDVAFDMTKRLDPEIRARLGKQGTFDSFCRERTKLIHNGTTPVEAGRMALKKWDKPGAGDPLLPVIEDEGMAKTPEDRAKSTAFRKATKEEARVPRRVFEGKECTANQAVEWVAENLEVRGIKPQDAPSAAAWAMLMWARTSPITKSEYWKHYYGKIISGQATDEAEGPFKDDGREILDTIDTLRAAGRGGTV